MPGHDDTLNAGGPALDPLDELCTCGHTRGEHHTLDEDCTNPACKCAGFQSHGHEFGNSAPSTETQLGAARQAKLDAANASLERVQREHERANAIATAEHARARSPRNNTHEAVDRIMADEERKVGNPPQTHDDRARGMDVEPMSPTEAMSDEERIESDAVQQETLDNRCTCGHRYGDRWVDDQCSLPGCECDVFEALLKPVDYPDHKAPEFGGDARRPYTPPLLRKRLVGEDELRKILTDVGRLDLLEQLPEAEVDRVTTNYDAEHWQQIERLARSPQGSSETNTARDRTIKAIALALLDLHQCLGVTTYTERLVEHIEKNADVIRTTGEVLDRIVDRLAGPEDT